MPNKVHAPEENDTLKTMELFLAMFAHEIRTQLSGVVQACQYAQEGTRRNFYLSAISAVIQDTLHLLDNLLKTVLFRNGRLVLDTHKESFPFKPWITSIVQSWEAEKTVQQKELNLIINPALEHCSITTDKIIVGQILHNLLSNALKWSYKGSCILIDCHLTGERLTITVENKGNTIPPEKINRLFEPYYRLDNSYAGTGLGLYLSKQYADALEGDISVQSKDCCTAFTVNIPR